MKATIFTSLTSRLLKGGLAIALATVSLVSAAKAAVNAQEQALFNLIKNDSAQQRPFMTLDPILCQAARAKAQDMANRGYFDHTDPDGHGPNFLVRKAGYKLPANYDQAPDGNNIESASAGRSSASDTWESLKDSPQHAEHLLAKNSFYREQTSVGVGYVNSSSSEYTYYWIIITAPPAGPKVNFESPANNSDVNAASVTVSGGTTGDPDAASVQVRIENANGNSEWITASGTKDWTATVSGLIPGANTLHARSLKADSSVLDDATRTVNYVVLAPLTVNISGNGSVTSGFSGTTMREQGQSFTVTAKPAAGYVFAGWTGGITSTKAALTFTMPESLNLTASFVANPFVAGAGRYAAVVGNGANSSLVKVTLTSAGTFTARVKNASGVTVFTGSFDGSGDASVSSKGMSLALHFTGGQVTGSLNGADFALDGLVPATTTTTPFAGKFTVILPANENAGANVPQGDGVATVKVAKNGVAKITGTLADGSAFSASSPIGKGGEFPIFAKAGLLTGTLSFRNTAASDLDGTLLWSAPAFSTAIEAVGSRYTAPAAGQRVVNVSAGSNNTAIALGAGGLSGQVVQSATLNADNTVILSTPAVKGITFHVNAANGRFNGSFIHPQTGVLTKFRGAILQKQNAGFGFFNGGGYATFAPSAEARVAQPE